jgi:hypothetical protein
MTATGGAAGDSSLVTSVRPNCGDTRAIRNPDAVIAATSIGSIVPLTVRLRSSSDTAPRSFTL